jgi:hypothetical protein
MHIQPFYLPKVLGFDGTTVTAVLSLDSILSGKFGCKKWKEKE